MAYPLHEQNKDSTYDYNTYDSRYANFTQLKYVGEYAQFPKATMSPTNNNIYGASTISITPNHKHEYGKWNPRQFEQPRKFPTKQPPPPPFPPSTNTPDRVQEPANRTVVATKTTSTINCMQTITPKYNSVVSPSMSFEKITQTGTKIINNGILLDESKSFATKKITISKDSSKTSRFKDYTLKIKNNLKSSSNKSFSIEDFKSTAWDASSMCRKPKELFRADGEFSKILSTQIKKNWSDWIDGIINNEVKACMKKHAETLTPARRNIEMYQKQIEQDANELSRAALCEAEAMYQEQKEQAVNELLNLILGNIRTSLKLGNKAPMPDDCKSILSCMNRIALEKFPEEKSTRGIVFNIFLFRYIIPNLVEPDQLSKNIHIHSCLQIQQELITKLSNDSKCPDFLVPIFI